MNIHVEYFAQLRNVAGCDSEMVQASEAATVADLVALLVGRHGEALGSILAAEDGGIRPGIIVLRNDVPVVSGGRDVLRGGDRLSFFSPVAGG